MTRSPGNMSSKFAAFLMVILFPLFSLAQKEKSTVVETVNGKTYLMHTVVKEQTLYNISKLYSTSVNDIVIENPEAIDGIKVGQVLKIPTPKAVNKPIINVFTKEDSIKYIFHRVEKGQTLYSLSRQYSVSIDDIHKTNPAIKEGLKEGQIVKITRNKTNALLVKADSVKTISQPVTTLPLEIMPDSIMFQKKSEYKVALFLPFNLSSAANIDIDRVIKGDASFPSKTEVSISFYQGVLMAIDSMVSKGLSCKLLVYDIDENDSAALAQILEKPELKEVDLILGPLYYSNVKDITKFANANKIHNVSPLSQLNKILFNNPYTSKTVPSSITQVEQMALYVAEKYSKENLIIVSARKDAASYTSIKKILNDKRAKESGDTIKVGASLNAVTGMLSSSKKNIILFPTNDQAYVTDFMTKLNQSAGKFDITVFGMASWRNFDNVDPEYLDTLHVHTPSVFYVDYADSTTLLFIKKYREKFFADPESFAFQGYDVGLFYLEQLFEHGANFHYKLNGKEYNGIQTRFSFYKTAQGSGYDNQEVYIIKQHKHQLVKVE